MKRRRPSLGHLVAARVYAEREQIDRVLRTGGAREHELDDLVQLVVLAAVEAANERRVTWTRRKALLAWLRTVAWHLALTHAARAAREETIRRAIDPPDEAAPAAEARYLAREALRVLAKATTPERYETLCAHLEGEAAADIAGRDGVRLPTVYDRMRRAREDFRAALARERAVVACPVARRR